MPHPSEDRPAQDRPAQARYWVYVLPLGVLGFLLALFFVGLDLNPRLVPSPLIGQPVPQFSLPRLDDPGKSFRHTELNGEISLFNVWATWCVSCKQEHPVLMRISASGEVPLYGLLYKDDASKGSAWLRASGDPYRANAVDQSGKVGIEWGTYGTPETFVIDSKGIIHYKHIGPISWQDWEEVLAPMIESLRSSDS